LPYAHPEHGEGYRVITQTSKNHEAPCSTQKV